MMSKKYDGPVVSPPQMVVIVLLVIVAWGVFVWVWNG